jgi:hypothetical protein
MEIKRRWERFITTMKASMEEFDPRGADILYTNLFKEPPPNKEALEWSMTYIQFHHSANQFMCVCLTQGMKAEAEVVSKAMERLNEALLALRSFIQIPQEFTKEVKF